MTLWTFRSIRARLVPSAFLIGAPITVAYFVEKYKKDLPLLSLAIAYNFHLTSK
jgi:hypothetical protein